MEKLAEQKSRTITELTQKMENKLVSFSGSKCILKFRRYNSGRLFASLIDSKDGMPVARITLDYDPVPVIDDMIIVKSYSENQGMYEALLKAGVIKKCERKVAIGFEEGLICFLNLD